MYARKQVVYTMNLQEHLVILLESRNTIAENMEKKIGNVINVPRNMPFNLIGKLTLRPVALESIDVIVVPFSQGN